MDVALVPALVRTCRQKEGRRWLEEEASWAAPRRGSWAKVSWGISEGKFIVSKLFTVVQIGPLRDITEIVLKAAKL